MGTQTKLTKALAAVEKVNAAITTTRKELAAAQAERGEILGELGDADADAVLGEKPDVKAVQSQKQRMASLPFERLEATAVKLQEKLQPAMLALAREAAVVAETQEAALETEITDRQAEVQGHLDAAAAAAYRTPALYELAPGVEFLVMREDREDLEARGAFIVTETAAGPQRSFDTDRTIRYPDNLAVCLQIARSATAAAQQAVAQLERGEDARDIVGVAERLASAQEPEPEAEEPIAEAETAPVPAEQQPA